ncbi:alpha and gamma adaptin binding protein p34-domain-containing protein [Chaetomium strumarium]|uniref:Alpha and gamma adaptin binding protein p34-domain-containing protein n=1 Tax=Chaetomium strumarium TaxID=1170767 RepID=A0AAJ0GYH1_9PEZI|nr:alpha and gamma adaptin binding protein p34-domain-containing protein [Chaetomium strumarium]
MEISNPRRILAVSLTDSAQHLSDVIKDLTGTHPTPAPSSSSSSPDPSPATAPDSDAADDPTPSLAGTTHPFALSTAYYTASIPIWLDLIASPAEWASSFLSPEAKEVLDVLGGVLVVFALPTPAHPPPPLTSTSPTNLSPDHHEQKQEQADGGQDKKKAQVRELITQVGKVVREGLGGWEWDGVGLGVGVSSIGSNGGLAEEEGAGALDEWEDLCAECGLEFVHVSRASLVVGKAPDGDKRNEFGERMGMARVIEALQANDWSGGGLEGGGDGDGEEEEEGHEGEGGKGGNNQRREEKEGDEAGSDFDPESLDFGFDREDFVGLRKAIWSGGQAGDEEDEEVGEEDVQKLERMMLKLQAVRDTSAGLPEEQRRRMAARAVGEVMKEL